MKSEEYLRIQTFYLGILGLIGLAIILQATQSFMIPFVIAVMLGILLDPILCYLQGRRVSEVGATLLILMGAFVLLTLLGYMVYGAISSVAQDIPKYVPKVQALFENIEAFALDNFHIDIERELIGTNGEQLFTLFSPDTIVQSVNSSLGSFVTFLSALLTVLLFLLFILLSRGLLKSKILLFLNHQKMTGEQSRELVDSIARQIQTYLWLKTLISLGTGFAVWIISILTGLDFPIVWAFWHSYSITFPPLGLLLPRFRRLFWPSFNLWSFRPGPCLSLS